MDYCLYRVRVEGYGTYFGITCNAIQRFSGHRAQARKGEKGKFYDALRVAPERATFEVLAVGLEPLEAARLEAGLLSEIGVQNLLNDSYLCTAQEKSVRKNKTVSAAQVANLQRVWTPERRAAHTVLMQKRNADPAYKEHQRRQAEEGYKARIARTDARDPEGAAKRAKEREWRRNYMAKRARLPT
jgi:hypothetical protein